MASRPSSFASAILAALLFAGSSAIAQDMGQMGTMDMSHPMQDASSGAMDDLTIHDSHMSDGSMKNMALHMTWSVPRPANSPDQARAAKLVTTLQSALAKYKDYRVAEADGFKPFHPEFKRQPVVHFTRWWYAAKAQFTFNPAQPTSLLYRRTASGGYELIGAMYTAPRRWSQDQLDQRVPLSVARWHQHVNICFPPKGADPITADLSKFGPNGSIASQKECQAGGGRFYPTLFGWMVHVYPWERDQRQVWAH
ncbi:MAG TPA: hypothetical protein VGH29_00330 [Candidatus Binataceae bacterium]